MKPARSRTFMLLTPSAVGRRCGDHAASLGDVRKVTSTSAAPEWLGIREVADGEVADQNEEKATELDSWADDLDSTVSSIDDFEGAVDDDGEPTDDSAATEWREQIVSELSVFDDCPL